MARRGQHRHRATVFVFVTVLIDAMGIGIILPVMPDLIRELTNLTLGDAARWGGYLSFVYALMQFAAGPTLGNLSDRFGRRPVLLVSLFALAVDYVIMASRPPCGCCSPAARWPASPEPPTPPPTPSSPTSARRSAGRRTSD